MKTLKPEPGSYEYLEHDERCGDAIRNKRRLLEHWDGARRFWRLLDAFIVRGMGHVACSLHQPYIVFTPHLVHKLNVGCDLTRCYPHTNLCPGCTGRVGDNRLSVHRPETAPIFIVGNRVSQPFSYGVHLRRRNRLLANDLCNDCSDRFKAAIPDTPKLQETLGLALSSIPGLVQHVLAFLFSPRPNPVCFRCIEDV